MRWHFIAMVLVSASMAAQTKSVTQPASQVVVLGSGMPAADPDRFGPAVAVIAGGKAYLVDCGVGVVRRAAAAQRKGIPALAAKDLNVAFITHLHSDHTLGYPDLILSPWVLGRDGPLNVYGPTGLKDMTDHILEAWKKDIDIRTHGLEGLSHAPIVQVHEIKSGVVYKDENVTVTAFLVQHGIWDEALGYRFDTAGRSIVISGDTAPTESVVKACNGCDVLLHEMYDETMPGDNAASLKYFAAFHTNPQQLAAIAGQARPKLLVLYHQMGKPIVDRHMVEALRASGYKGAVVSAHDLDVY
ncbi:MAG TPA: MBL fold metallo-hydrolase [Candidatus Sulfotelmatobacter sp.]|nr:MBL fold metallo-hydrolase [Candidatus Sulfotelmatobacter sp.]